MNKVGIVLINYNDYKNTSRFAKELTKFPTIEEVVIVDNNSNDKKDYTSLEDKKIHVIASDKNLGYAGASNVGAKYLVNKYKDINIIISNTDIYVKNDEVIKTLSNTINDEIACVMPKINENGHYKYGWKLNKACVDLLANIPLINRLYQNKLIYYKDDYFNKDIVQVDVVYGCFFMVNGKVFEEIDYLDDHTFLYNEENILGRKLQKNNKKSVCVTTVEVEHKHNATIGTNVSIINKFKMFKKGQIYYEKKYNNAFILTILILYLFYGIGLLGLKIKFAIKK